MCNFGGFTFSFQCNAHCPIPIAKGGVTNLKVWGGSIHWTLGGGYSKNTEIVKGRVVHDPPPHLLLCRRPGP